MLTALYTRMLVLARHPSAIWYLAGVSFAESSFFPIPPDVMLIPMAMVAPARAWWFACVTTVASVVGGICGYIIGYLFFYIVHGWIISWGYQAAYLQAEHWFQQWGFWAVLIAGFTPVPYKIFTITAGALSMPFLPFVLASLLGRGGRFFLIGGLMYFAGAKLEKVILKLIDRLGWLMVILIILGFIIWWLYRNILAYR